ncbi:MAG: hypothetical protein AAF958_12950 [Planctomycetota bacterium]
MLEHKSEPPTDFRSDLELIGSWLGIGLSVDDRDRVAKAERFLATVHGRTDLTDGDEVELLAVREFAERQFSDFDRRYEASGEKAFNLIKFDAILIAAVFSFLRLTDAQSPPMPVKFAMLFWFASMTLAAINCRRTKRPLLISVESMCRAVLLKATFDGKQDPRFNFQLAKSINVGTAQYAALLSRESRIANMALMLMVIGLTFLAFSIVAS